MTKPSPSSAAVASPSGPTLFWKGMNLLTLALLILAISAWMGDRRSFATIIHDAQHESEEARAALGEERSHAAQALLAEEERSRGFQDEIAAKDERIGLAERESRSLREALAAGQEREQQLLARVRQTQGEKDDIVSSHQRLEAVRAALQLAGTEKESRIVSLVAEKNEAGQREAALRNEHRILADSVRDARRTIDEKTHELEAAATRRGELEAELAALKTTMLEAVAKEQRQCRDLTAKLVIAEEARREGERRSSQIEAELGSTRALARSLAAERDQARAAVLAGVARIEEVERGRDRDRLEADAAAAAANRRITELETAAAGAAAREIALTGDLNVLRVEHEALAREHAVCGDTLEGQRRMLEEVRARELRLLSGILGQRAGAQDLEARHAAMVSEYGENKRRLIVAENESRRLAAELETCRRDLDAMAAENARLRRKDR